VVPPSSGRSRVPLYVSVASRLRRFRNQLTFPARQLSKLIQPPVLRFLNTCAERSADRRMTREVRVSYRVRSSAVLENVLVIRISGTYPDGSGGDRHAGFIRDQTRLAIDRFRQSEGLWPEAIVWDCSDLQYEWGNGIATTFSNLLTYPGEIVASGETRHALGTLLDSLDRIVPGVHVPEFATDESEAIAKLDGFVSTVAREARRIPCPTCGSTVVAARMRSINCSVCGSDVLLPYYGDVALHIKPELG
jgi:hypothetical protein